MLELNNELKSKIKFLLFEKGKDGWVSSEFTFITIPSFIFEGNDRYFKDLEPINQRRIIELMEDCRKYGDNDWEEPISKETTNKLNEIQDTILGNKSMIFDFEEASNYLMLPNLQHIDEDQIIKIKIYSEDGYPAG